jgi:uncharacterized protein (TIGR00369 family)
VTRDTDVSQSDLAAEELARLHAAFAQVAYARLLGLELTSVERGAAVVSLAVRPELTRMEGIMHGGALASVIDTASALAVLSLLAPGEQTVTVDLTLHFLRPISSGTVRAQARVLRAGRRIAFVAVEATNDAAELLATALTTYAIRR